MASVDWAGASKKDFLDFPATIRERFEYEFHRIGRGLLPTDGKPIKQVGPGVIEIRIKGSGNAYRVLYCAKVAGKNRCPFRLSKTERRRENGDNPRKEALQTLHARTRVTAEKAGE
jgi:putative component of toxin-antitoxin plasmid stabilization module